MIDEREFGKVQAEVESISREVEKMNQTQTIILQKLDGLADELSVYKTTVRVLKWIGIAFVSILTLKFGDISTIWEHTK